MHPRTVRVSGCQDLHSSLESLKENTVDVPIPGDWYILKIFQPVLQKIFKAGLRQLAQASWCCLSTFTALMNINFQFSHTPHFCVTSNIQSVMLEVFLSTISSNPSLADLVHKFNDGVASAFRQDGNIPDSNTQTIAESTEQLREALIHQQEASTDNTYMAVLNLVHILSYVTCIQHP